MSHKLTIKPVPHINKDGSQSASKKNYEVWDRTRGKTKMLGRFPSRSKAEEALDSYRGAIVQEHLSRHPNDQVFKQKHGVSL